MKQEVTDNGDALPLDVCFVLREGTDVTLVTWGAMTHETMLAAEQLATQGISAEVIDVATVKPLDTEIAERGLLNLLAPVRRVAGYDTVMPLYKLENDYMPDTARIVTAAAETMELA